MDSDRGPGDRPEPRSGAFGRLLRGLGKTREALSGKIKDLIHGPARVDGPLLDRIEELLLLSDVGPALTDEVIRSLRRNASGREISRWPELLDLVRAEFKRILQGTPAIRAAAPPSGPEVVLLVGVNGGGKTTTAGKLAARWAREGRRG